MSESSADRIQKIINDCLLRRADGEHVSDESIIAAHPELMPELANQLNILRLVQSAEQQVERSALTVRCPHCHSSTEMSADTDLSDVECAQCGGHFSLVGDDSGSFQSEHLESVGRFKLMDKLGMGAFGSVWSARDTQLDRLVAVKIPRKLFLTGKDTEKFIREARVAAQLKHPNIVRVHEVGREGDRIYIVTDYVHGVELGEWLAQRQPSFREAATLCATIADALEHAHQAGVVHRDLKSSNIMLDSRNQPHLMDFGLAKRESGEVTMTLEGKLLGTPAYMSPEQAKGSAHDADRRSDVYSLGVILFELLTGERPFRGSTRMLLHQILVEEAPSPRRLNNQVPRDLETICLRCLEKDPGRRYQSAGMLRDELHRFCRREPIVARPVSLAEHALRWCQRRPSLAAMAAALLAITLLGFGGVTWQLLRAEAAKKAAVGERAAADAERTKAVQLAEELAKERDEAQWQSYRASIAAATSALDGHNPELTRRKLESAPRRYRNWEWRHLFSRLGSESVLIGHTDSVWSVAYSPDGSLIASGSSDGTVRIWDAMNTKLISVLPELSVPYFSPDGDRLAAGDIDQNFCLWDTVTHRVVKSLRGSTMPIDRLVFSSDSKLLTGRAADGKVRLWDAKTGALVRRVFDAPTAVESLAFRPDGRQLIGGDVDGRLVLWDVSSGEMLNAWQAHSAQVTAVGFSPDAARIVSCSQYPENTVRLWHASTGEPIVDMTGHRNSINTVTYSPDGDRLVSTSFDKTARLWDGMHGNPIAILKGHRGRVTRAVFLANGNYLATASADRSLRLWDAHTGDLVASLQEHTGMVRDVAISPDGTRLASGSDDKTIRVWNVDLAERDTVLRGHTSYVYDVAFSPDGARLASAAWDGTVRLWDVTGRRSIGVLKHDDQIVVSVAFSSDGRHLVSMVRGNSDASMRNSVYVWDADTGKARTTLPASTSPSAGSTLSFSVRAVFNPAGTLVAAAGGEASVHLWNLGGEPVAVFGKGRGGSNDVAFNPRGDQVASAERGGTIRIWGIPGGEEVTVLRGHDGVVCSVCYSRDGLMLASGGNDKTARIWDARKHAPLAVLPHGGTVYCAAFNSDGTRLATACDDNVVRLWDISTGEEVAELQGHEDYVHAVAFSPDGTKLVSCSGDYTVRIWDSVPTRSRGRSE